MMRGPFAILSGVFLLGSTALAAEGIFPPQAIEFFESKIRPVLSAECYECHNAKKSKGGLRLDYRDGWKKGGDSGDTIVPGDSRKSLLIQSIRHEDPDLKMPDKAPKLDDKIIADFEQWINMGAPDPRDHPPADPDAKPGWPELLATRRGWWSLQPVSRPVPPEVKDQAWSANPIDRFILAKLESRSLAPAVPADPRTLIRRLTFTLTGLPPAPVEVEAFVGEWGSDAEKAIDNATARLLASPHFGEHWGRHWLDLMRYAETHGSEGDPEIRDAWRYRDYVIRALNADVPVDQFIREHIAGDLLPNPRMNPDGFSESTLGTANLRLVEHGFQPVDTLDDQVKTIDSQIDVVSKAFQGLTISCARCHDHKFDAISQHDYHAMYSVFASVRPAQVTIDGLELQAKNRAELEKLHGEIRNALADAWLSSVEKFGDRLLQETNRAANGSGSSIEAPGEKGAASLSEAATTAEHPFYLWAKAGAVPDDRFADAWKTLASEIAAKRADAERFNAANFRPMWNLARSDYSQWFRHGSGLSQAPHAPGEFAVAPEGERVLEGIYPAGVLTNRLSGKHNALLTSPRFKIDSDSISIRASGAGGASVRVIVDNYPLSQAPIFPKALLEKGKPGWVRLDTAYRKGSWAYLEFGTREDVTRPLPIEKKDPSPDPTRSGFAVSEIVAHNSGEPPRDLPLATIAILEGAAPQNPTELANLYAESATRAVRAWRENKLTDAQAALLDSLVRCGALPVTLTELPNVQPLVVEYRRLESEVPKLRRAPGVIETAGFDSPFLPRGDHTKPGESVPRGYLEVFGSKPYHTALSGRRELAEEIASAKNPLTARVMVNRVWHWMFGRGLMASVDNFGRLGEKPSHPELLDHLATRFVENGWSMKTLIREIVATRTFQMSSEPSPRASEVDPGNELLSHFRVQRLPAEAIRDSLLVTAGDFKDELFGKPVEDRELRRSIYLPVRRTNLHSFLQSFDAPKPFTTLGRREATNVPGQSLTMLNSPFVIEQARKWSRHLVRDGCNTPEERIRAMFAKAFARPPGEEELKAATDYLNVIASDREIGAGQLLASEPVWQDFAQSLFNLKEFIYLR